MNFIKSRWVIGLSAGLILSLFLLYAGVYSPLWARLRSVAETCRKGEAAVRDARDLIAAFKAKEVEKTLISETQVSDALEQVTSTGNQVGVTFLSVTPRTPGEGKEGYRLLPVEMEIEAAYAALGEFWGKLDDLRGSLITVHDFIVTPKVEDPMKLNARITLNLYLVEREHAG